MQPYDADNVILSAYNLMIRFLALREQDDDVMQNYKNQLAGYDTQAILVAMEHLMRNPLTTHNGYRKMPLPRDIIDIMHPEQTLVVRHAEACALLHKTMRKGSRLSSTEASLALGKTTMLAVDAHGGWRAVVDAQDDFKINAVKKLLLELMQATPFVPPAQARTQVTQREAPRALTDPTKPRDDNAYGKPSAYGKARAAEIIANLERKIGTM